MSQSHTPGPWQIKPSNNEITNVDHGRLPFAIVAGYSLIGATYENGKDARLIAAAPDLLEALQEVVKLANQAHDHWDNDRDAKVGKILLALSGHMPRYDKRIDAIHAAIAKATGEHHGN
jgi:hypothetical protein